MNKRIFLGLVLAGLTGTGCSETTEAEPVHEAKSVIAGKLGAHAAQEALDEDTIAVQAYERVRQAHAARQAQSVRLAVYSLQPVDDVVAQVDARARTVGLEMGAARKSGHELMVEAGHRVLSIDARSGTERYVDRSRFHSGRSVATLPLARADYIARAREHVQRALPEVATRNMRAYKFRQYVNESAGPNGERTGPQVYQVAVAFQEMVGDLPVIGSGGKVAVHLTPNGEIIAHESAARGVGRRLADLSGSEVLDPEVARRQAEERLAARGVRLENYRLVRAELGYLRHGRHSPQSVMAPHYAYLYEPLSPAVGGRKVVEVVPAVTNPEVLAQLRQDAQAEAQRKAERMAYAQPEDVR
ncbi:hypothetical protein F0U60_07940 [Archangium minus]|uniref:Lipoprotein n=1 Tax=Archangium minus TaxID=83450 RepID=A0ABY9WJX4_9BACT|nr:hypothetical protein F0U60_07940 [Archangium minus]